MPAVSLGVALVLVLSCADSSAPRPAPGVRTVSGSFITDSILSILAGPLVVQVRDSAGAPIAGRAVTFTSPSNAISFSATHQVSLDSFRISPLVVTSDASGAARAWLAFSVIAGPAVVVVSSPDVSPADTAKFTVTPGNAVGVRAVPADTAVMIGHSFTLHGGVVDSYGNIRPDAVTYDGATTGITIQGKVLSGAVIARASYLIHATIAGKIFTDVGRISVVPVGRIAASNGSTMFLFNTDGSDLRAVASVAAFDLHWSPSGSEIAFDQSLTYGGDSTIMAVDTLGHIRHITAASIGGVHQGPSYSRDGQWVYFARYPGNFQGEGRGLPALWRVHPDGTGAAAIPDSSGGDNAYPSISPDGSTLAFLHLDPGPPGSLQLGISTLTIATGAIQPLNVPFSAPAWSPTSDVIAYTGGTSGPLYVMQASGTGQRLLTNGEFDGIDGVSWSPDGQWIVVAALSGGSLSVVNAASGLVLPLGHGWGGGTLFSPAWRP